MKKIIIFFAIFLFSAVLWAKTGSYSNTTYEIKKSNFKKVKEEFALLPNPSANDIYQLFVFAARVCSDRYTNGDYACYQCCAAKPPAGFDPDTDEMDYGRVIGNTCECHWKTRPQQTYSDNEPGCSFQEKNRSQSDCNRCCYDPSHGLIGGELESDGICVCLHR